MILKHNYSYRNIVIVLVLMMTLPIHINAVAKEEPKVFGWLEYSYLMPWGIKVKTKLDTGAKTSSIHALNMKPFKREGKPWVRFTLGHPIGMYEGLEEGIVVERPVTREVRIKERVGESKQRYVVELEFCLDGKTMPLEVSLSDRSNFNYELLLGRRTMVDTIMVDPARTFTVSNNCKQHIISKEDTAKK